MAKRVLLIDHHPKLHELLSTLLAAEGFEILSCHCTGAGNSCSPGKHQCDVILANIAMPEGNWKFDFGGWRCLQAYMAAGIPAVAYTLATEYEIGDVRDRLEDLHVPLLCHPIELQMVTEIIEKVINRAKPMPKGRLALAAS